MHVHCDWNGGANSLSDLAAAAMVLGYEYLGISDHTKFLRIEHGLDEEALKRSNLEIDRLNRGFQAAGKKFRLLKGCEANIMADGSLDITDEALSQLDFVIAGIHSHFKMDRQQMTERLLTAMRNPHVDIIAHPTGRIIKRRDEYAIDLTAVIAAAR